MLLAFCVVLLVLVSVISTILAMRLDGIGFGVDLRFKSTKNEELINMVMDYRNELSKLNRNDLNIIAKKLKMKYYRRGTKEHLINSIVSENNPEQIKKVISVSFWDRYHNHVYGAASIIGLAITIVSLFPIRSYFTSQAPQNNQKSPDAVTSASANSAPIQSPIQTLPPGSPSATRSATPEMNSAPRLEQLAEMRQQTDDVKKLKITSTSPMLARDDPNALVIYTEGYGAIQNNKVQVFVNGKDVSSAIFDTHDGSNASSISLMGTRKKINVRVGENVITVRVKGFTTEPYQFIAYEEP